MRWSSRQGVPVAPLKITRRNAQPSRYRGAIPGSIETFQLVEYHFEILAKRIRELSFLNHGVKIELIDQRTGKRKLRVLRRYQRASSST